MEKFVVSARKYRPASFDAVIGQGHITETLKNAVGSHHLAQSFLFCGPRGVGKTTCARILAKVINCSNPTENVEPCGACDACKAFSENKTFNIYELDAASNNSVDDMRSLIEQVRYTPQSGKYKIYIIDEVHMLSQSAFNAFLKTLEEPPPYAIFILATTEKQKILPTILSRCQIFDFRRIQIAEIVQHLQDIATKEGIEAEKEVLYVIAQKSDGALRDALSLFDKLVSFSGNKLTYQDVLLHLNVLDHEYYFKMTDCLLTQDIPGALVLFNEVRANGFEGDDFIAGLSEHFRNLLVCMDDKTASLLETADALKDKYQQQADITPASFLITALNIANTCDINYRNSKNKSLQVELALIKMAYINQKEDFSSYAQKPVLAKVEDQKKNYKPVEEKIVEKPEAEDPIAVEADEPSPQPQSNIPSFKIKTAKESPGIKDGDDKELLGTNSELDSAKAVENQEESITQEQLADKWKACAAKLNGLGKSNLFSLMDLVEPALVDARGKFELTLMNTVQASVLNEAKANILMELQETLGIKSLFMEVKVDESAKVKETVPYTDKERYNKMVEKNPSLKDFKQEFDLEIEF